MSNTGKVRITTSPALLAVRFLCVFVALSLSMHSLIGRTMGTPEGRVLNEIESATMFYLEKGKQLPTNWAQLNATHDFTKGNLLLSMEADEPRVAQQEFVFPPKPLKLLDGRKIILIQRRPGTDTDGNEMRRYVWVKEGRVWASTSSEDSMPAEIRGTVFPETDPALVKLALAEVLPKFVEKKQYRRNLKKVRVYWLRNRVLSFLFGRDVAVARDGSMTATAKLILSAVALIMVIVPPVCVTRHRRLNQSRSFDS